MLDGGEILSHSATVLVSLTAGPDLSMADLNTVTGKITERCPSAQVIVGAAVSPDFGDCLGVTIIAACSPADDEADPAVEPEVRSSSRGSTTPVRTVEPATLTGQPERASRPEAGAERGGSARRKSDQQFRQGQLPLQMVSKGGFEKCEPTIHKGEDLDVPTYVRRGLALN